MAHDLEVREPAREIKRAVHVRYPCTDEVRIVSVIDLSVVPTVCWLAVGMVLNTAYERATEEIPPGMDPAEYVINGLNYGGFVSRLYGVRNTGCAAIAVEDEDSKIASSYQGEQSVDIVLEMLNTSWNTL